MSGSKDTNSGFLRRLTRRADIHNPLGYCFTPPETIVLGVNNICNLHCVMCDVGTGTSTSAFARSLTGARPVNMPEDLLRRVIDEAALFRPRPEIGFAFTEPGIYPHLAVGIAHAHRSGLRTSLTTNGWTLRHLAADLADAGLDLLYVSLDGPPDVHDAVRRKPGSFTAAADGIVELNRLRSIPTNVCFAVTNENHAHIAPFLRSISHLPLASVILMHTNFVTPEMVGAHNQVHRTRYPAAVSSLARFDPEKVDTAVLSRELAEAAAPGQFPFRVDVQPSLLAKEDLDKYYRASSTPIGKRCIDPHRFLMVKSSGDVIAAHGRCYDVRVGNLYDERLARIWNSEPMRAFRSTLVRSGGMLPACTRCCGGFSR